MNLILVFFFSSLSLSLPTQSTHQHHASNHRRWSPKSNIALSDTAAVTVPIKAHKVARYGSYDGDEWRSIYYDVTKSHEWNYEQGYTDTASNRKRDNGDYIVKLNPKLGDQLRTIPSQPSNQSRQLFPRYDPSSRYGVKEAYDGILDGERKFKAKRDDAGVAGFIEVASPFAQNKLLATGVSGIIPIFDPDNSTRLLLGTSTTVSTQFYLFLDPTSIYVTRNSTEKDLAYGLIKPYVLKTNEQAVQLRLPILDSTDMSKRLACATISSTPPANVELILCGMQTAGYSQTFIYDTVTGEFRPLYTPIVEVIPSNARGIQSSSKTPATADSLIRTSVSNTDQDRIVNDTANPQGTRSRGVQQQIQPHTSASTVHLYFIPSDQYTTSPSHMSIVVIPSIIASGATVPDSVSLSRTIEVPSVATRPTKVPSILPTNATESTLISKSKAVSQSQPSDVSNISKEIATSPLTAKIPIFTVRPIITIPTTGSYIKSVNRVAEADGTKEEDGFDDRMIWVQGDQKHGTNDDFQNNVDREDREEEETENDMDE